MNDGNHQPMATYRLQFSHDFRFTDARALVPYFSRLGITHIYASPILRARQASTHGYDVVDPKTINPNLGDETEFISLVTDLRQFGIGVILDIVPNHMAASIENPYWRDVLTYGPSSPFAGWFDINWRMPDPDMWGRVLVPVLGAPRNRVLEQDQIRLVWSDGRFLVQYFEHVFPVDPATVPMICTFGLEDLKQRLEDEHPTLQKIGEILDRLRELPNLVSRLRRGVHIDRDETEHWLAQFAQLIVQSPRIQQWAEQTAEQFSQGNAGRRRMKKLLDNQPYRLVHWRAAARAINYRRFFDINALISIRQEDPQVFQETHSTILRWINDGLIDGLRIDHIDGLVDPLGYLERLAEALSSAERSVRMFPVFVEKILAPEEKLPCGWPVAGTTGYEFLNQVEAAFISPEGFTEIEQHYRRMFRRPVHFEQFAGWGKRRVLRNDLSPHVGRLAETLLRLAELSWQTPPTATPDDVIGPASSLTEPQEQNPTSAAATLIKRPQPTKRDFVDAVVEVIAALPVYRTYVDSHHCSLSDADRHYVETALQGAHDNGRASSDAIDFVGEVLLLENNSRLSEHDLHARVNFIRQFQQLTGPAAAKGIEDTALYAYVPLASFNEVGGEPRLLSDDPVERLQQANDRRATTWPQTMLCVTTHDTKRTADVRARLDVLSELPHLWTDLVRRWRQMNRVRTAQVSGKRAPDAAAEYLFYQTVVGLWPAPDPQRADELPTENMLQQLRERIEAYMLKAAREAKTHTSWTNQKQAYEDALLTFVGGLLSGEDDGSSFLSDIQRLVARIARPGFWNSLSCTLIQFTAPGTPDLYQGDELWNFALVDPDNRRPVDYEKRQGLLDEVINGMEAPADSRPAFVRRLVGSPEDGRIKLHVIHSALAARREYPDLFGNGQYVPLTTDGAARDHVLAYARMARTPGSPSTTATTTTGRRDDATIIVVPRLTTQLLSNPSDTAAAPIGEAVWSDTIIHLPDPLRDRTWTCAVTREQIRPASNGFLSVAEVLASFPAALLLADR